MRSHLQYTLYSPPFSFGCPRLFNYTHLMTKTLMSDEAALNTIHISSACFWSVWKGDVLFLHLLRIEYDISKWLTFKCQNNQISTNCPDLRGSFFLLTDTKQDLVLLFCEFLIVEMINKAVCKNGRNVILNCSCSRLLYQRTDSIVIEICKWHPWLSVIWQIFDSLLKCRHSETSLRHEWEKNCRN